MANEFRRLLQEHLRKTRAGLFGQFEHAWNFAKGGDSEERFKIGPGESITFSGQLTDETPVTMKVTNDIAGNGFIAQSSDPNDTTIVAGGPGGQATFEFESGGGGPAPGQSLSYSGLSTLPGTLIPGMYRAIDETDTNILSLASGVGGNGEIERGIDGNYYLVELINTVVGDPRMLIPDGGMIASYTPAGVRRWRGVLPILNSPSIGNDASFRIAHDGDNDRVACQLQNSNGTLGPKVVCFDANGPDQGGPFPEPAALWTSVELSPWTSTGNQPAILAIRYANNSFYVLVSRNRTSPTAQTVGPNLYRLDSALGTVLASVNLDMKPFQRASMDVTPSGDVVVLTGDPTDAYDGATGGTFHNCFRFNASLVLVDGLAIDWVAEFGFVRNDGHFCVALSNGNTLLINESSPPFGGAPRVIILAPDFSTRAVDISTTQRFSDVDACEVGGPGGYAGVFAADVIRFNASAVEQSRFPDPTARGINYVHTLPAAMAPLITESSASATKFTTELSSTPPGRVPAIVAVKYDNGDITDVYWNAVDCEFDPNEWTASHSAEGDIPVGETAAVPQWDYNSPL